MSGVPKQQVEKKPFITLKVQDQEGDAVAFRVKRSTGLKDLMSQYCRHQSVSYGTYRFLFDGSRIGPDQTPEELGMEDEDEIDAMLFMYGGFVTKA